MRIYLDAVGCRLNHSEIETFGRQFRRQGHEIVREAAEADLAVINTCAVTAEAAADSRQLLRRTSRAGAGEVVATGCWATLAPAAAEAMPEVRRVVSNAAKDLLVAQVLGRPPEAFDLEPLERTAAPGARLRTRAFIKVQDGCDNRCTFCITTLARGPGRSRPLPGVLADIQEAAAGGAREAVLTGVHLGSWGQEDGRHLKDLVSAVLRETDVSRVRLSSLEPWDLDDDFFELWTAEPRLCRHLHLPLQSGSDRTLRRMARKTTRSTFRRLVRAARQASPEIAVTTDLIAGFPGETQSEFAETLEFVAEMDFAGAHVFTYSERPGTAAASMPGAVPHALRRERSAALRDLVACSEERYRCGFVGRQLEVLWESAVGLGPEGWQMSGWTDNYLRVTAVAPRDLWNELTPVFLEEAAAGGLKGRIEET